MLQVHGEMNYTGAESCRQLPDRRQTLTYRVTSELPVTVRNPYPLDFPRSVR